MSVQTFGLHDVNAEPLVIVLPEFWVTRPAKVFPAQTLIGEVPEVQMMGMTAVALTVAPVVTSVV